MHGKLTRVLRPSERLGTLGLSTEPTNFDDGDTLLNIIGQGVGICYVGALVLDSRYLQDSSSLTSYSSAHLS